MPRRLTLSCAVALALALAACGDGGGPPSRPTLGAPITGLTPNAWTWVGFDDAQCDDGSTTGIGVNVGDDANVLVFLDGGGACWNWETCVPLRGTPNAVATSGPFQQAQLTKRLAELPGSVLDRAVAANPFRTWTLVFVPYCTGDVHAGDNVVVYSNPPAPDFTYHHVGHANVVAYLRRLAATFPSPPKVVVSGASAGGFGAFANYDTFHQYWPGAASYLVDDSGPPLPSAETGGHAIVDTWDASWRLYALLDTWCPLCRSDISQGVTALAAKYPHDRVSLLSYVQDSVVPLFFGIPVQPLLGGPSFVTGLDDLVHHRFDAHASTKYFLVAGSGHTVLGHPGDFTTGGTALWDFLSQQVTDDPAWASRAP